MFLKLKGGSANDVKATDTFIGEGTIIEGKLITAASLRIEGTIVGEIACAGDVTIGAKGIVRSNIEARNIYNAGIIEGNIHARSKISISSKGRVFGNMSAASLHISEGAVFRGECRMESPSAQESGGGENATQPEAQRQKNKDGKEKRQATA